MRIVKPYSVILSILNEMSKIDKQQCYFLNDEIYLLVVNAYKNNFEDFNIYNAKNMAVKIIQTGNSNKLDELKFIKGKSNHLNPIKGFLKTLLFNY